MYIIQREDKQYYASDVTDPSPSGLYWSPLKSKATQFTNLRQAEMVRSQYHKIQDDACVIIDLSLVYSVWPPLLPSTLNLRIATESEIEQSSAAAIRFVSHIQSKLLCSALTGISAVLAIQEFILHHTGKTSIPELDSEAGLTRFQDTVQYKNLLNIHSLDDYGVWAVRGVGTPEAFWPSADLGYYSGALSDVIHKVVQLPAFWSDDDSWCGTITVLDVVDVYDKN